MKALRASIIFGILTSILCYCNNEKGKPFPMNNSSVESIEKLSQLVIEQGDTAAFYQLSVDYMDSPFDSYLYTSLIMANKYNYPPAYMEVYNCLTGLPNKKDFTELDDLDEKTRALALKYLIEGSGLGCGECKQFLGRYYIDGKYVPKDIERGNRLIDEANN